MSDANTKPESPQAFPQHIPVQTPTGIATVAAPGMTLRDCFAGQALPEVMRLKHTRAGEVAQWAYEVADAMLRAREAK